MKKRTITGSQIIYAVVFIQVALWALFQVIAVPLIHFRSSFSLLFVVFIVTAVVLLTFVLFQIRRYSVSWQISFPKAPLMWLILILTIGLILFQTGHYIFGMHLDEDDARWIAEAGDAITKDKMFLHNPATGEYLGSFRGEMRKDVWSPLPMYIAVLSRITAIRPAVMAHTVFAPIILLLSYVVFMRLGQQLFSGSSERIIFVFAVAVIRQFFAGNPYTEAVFALMRIWQGKAIVAGMMIPLILSQIIQIQQEDTVKNWLILCMIGCATCLLSGMGILISLMMIGFYGFYVIICKRWKRIPLWLLCLLPVAVYEFFYSLQS